ncbi:MAG: hypothetical protein ACE5IY_10730 [bacterium]
MDKTVDKPTVLIIGIGEVGRYLLEFLVRSDFDIDVVAADVHLEDVEAKINNARNWKCCIDRTCCSNVEFWLHLFHTAGM